MRSIHAHVTGTDGASAPFFSPDGQAIAFFSGGKLLLTSVNGGVATICDAPEDTGNGDQMIAAAISTNPDFPIDGAPKVLFTGQYQTTDAPHYDVAADGQRFLMVKPVADDADSRTIRVVDGWSVELGRRGAALSMLH